MSARKARRHIDPGITSIDELFMNEAEREENRLPKIYDLYLEDIDDFPDHPFGVRDDEDMRLNNLVPELMELVDEGRMKMRQAVELSYVDEDSQRKFSVSSPADLFGQGAKTLCPFFFKEGKLCRITG